MDQTSDHEWHSMNTANDEEDEGMGIYNPVTKATAHRLTLTVLVTTIDALGHFETG